MFDPPISSMAIKTLMLFHFSLTPSYQVFYFREIPSPLNFKKSQCFLSLLENKPGEERRWRFTRTHHHCWARWAVGPSWVWWGQVPPQCCPCWAPLRERLAGRSILSLVGFLNHVKYGAEHCSFILYHNMIYRRAPCSSPEQLVTVRMSPALSACMQRAEGREPKDSGRKLLGWETQGNLAFCKMNLIVLCFFLVKRKQRTFKGGNMHLAPIFLRL